MMVRCASNYTWACLMVLASLFLGSHPRRLSNRSALLQELLSEYGPTSVRPVYNVTKTTTVKFRLLITQLIELDEKYQTIQISGWLTQFWEDEFLTWDPDQRDGVTSLFVHTSNIWLPDTTLYKNVDPKFESYKDISAKVNSTGQVKWSTPVILKCTCRIDARLFPFDIQVCELRFSPWAYDASEVNLQAQEALALHDQYRDDGVWELLKIEVVRREITYACCLAPYPELSYFIHLKRRPLFHVLNILLPCVLLSILNLLVFALPPESGEKIQLGMTNLLALVLFQQLITDALPPTSAAESPRIGFYFTPMIIIGCTSVMCTVLVLKLFYHNDRRPIPTWLRKFISRTALILFYRLQSHSKPGSRHVSESRKQSGTRIEMNSDSSLMENSETAENKANETNAVRKHVCSNCRMSTRENGPTGNLSINIPPRADKTGRRGKMKTSELTSKEVILDWKDVALVIDRAAMVLSALVTACAIGTTVVMIAIGA
ncbi:neuronal acetylcholine receptor subunit alpha-7-like [Asterias rubens]|uniref:neuronal acetylcholine receptor subunit alpha-7-like n=1 Tax=Asterias rubens TaxID=7604 RepID=UPI001455A617|nr:neuronal acetylcholine receptor subunit alpha-7-like [Asterias rubens]